MKRLLDNFYQSLRQAIKGVGLIWRQEANFRYQSIFGVAVMIAMFIFPTTKIEKIILLVLITMVLILEILNSVIERLVDMFKPRLHNYAKVIKDLMAAVVLLSSCLAAVVGVMIFWPDIFS